MGSGQRPIGQNAFFAVDGVNQVRPGLHILGSERRSFWLSGAVTRA